MANDNGERLKNHLKWLLNTQLADEITYMIEGDGQWASYFDQLIALVIRSRDNQTQAFAAAKQAQLDYETRHEKAFAVFNFFKGIALSWLTAQLQYRVFANLFSKKEWQVTGNTWETTMLHEVDVADNPTNNKLAGKIFGDLGKEIAGFLLQSVGFTRFLNPSPALVPNVHALAYSPTAEDLRRIMGDEMKKQKDHVMSVMQDLGNVIEPDTEFGDRLVERVYKMYPYIQEEAVEQVGQDMLNDLVNKLRENWAKTPGFEFFAYDPPKRPDYILVRHMEKELWILWFIEFHHQANQVLDGADYAADRIAWYDSIMGHMSDLNIPTDDVLLTTGPARDDADEQLIRWCRNHKPEDPTRDRKGTLRDLKNTPIQKWKRPERRT